MIKSVSNFIFKRSILWILMAAFFLCGCKASQNNSPAPAGLPEAPIPVNAADLEVGDTFTFGSYEQDNDLKNGSEPIEWQVLAIRDGSALVISRYALDAKPYHKSYIHVTWKMSTMRKWLNSEFFDNSFTTAEKNRIAQVTIDNPSNTCSGARGGGATKDRIFLLNIEEANAYFSDNSARQCEATAFAKAKGAFVAEDGYSWWWLRSPGRTDQTAAVDLYDGYVSNVGHAVIDKTNVVRPAFWINL